VFPVGKHYVAVNSGLPWWTGAEDVGFPFVPVQHRKLSTFKDLIFFNNSAKNILTDGYFTPDWTLTEEMRNILTSSGAVSITR
jgi:hypothetical protein